MIVLGIDTGSAHVGWSLIDHGPDTPTPKLVGYGVWDLNDASKYSDGMNLSTFRSQRQLNSLLSFLTFDHVIIEMVPFQQMGSRDRVLGVANFFRSYAIIHNIAYKEVSANALKKKFLGVKPSSDKELTKVKVQEIFPEVGDSRLNPATGRLNKWPADVYDAISIGYAGPSVAGEWWQS